ncbi:MAG: apolipoprotein N-acyltransferase [Bacteroidales bacterium]|nr:apolipoprotein N-acyltransferase [Bacteroidales bacterium]
MANYRRLFPILALSSAVLLSVPYIIPHTGWLMLIGFIPLLSMENIAFQTGKKHFWIWHYLTFVLWNAFTTFWVCNATVGGGIFAVLANSLQMSVVFGLFRLSRKSLRGAAPYVFLALLWIAWEKYYLTVAQISWPWLVLGNGFAGNVALVQWYEYTGVLGGSLWVWAVNLGIFGLMMSLADGSFFARSLRSRAILVSAVVLSVLFPVLASEHLYYHYEEEEKPLEVAAAQPDFDPYHKFESMTQAQQTAFLLNQLEEALPDRMLTSDKFDSLEAQKPLLILAPETFTSDVWLNMPWDSPTLRAMKDFLRDVPGATFITGASTHEFWAENENGSPRLDRGLYPYLRDDAPSITARRMSNGMWYESHNSAVRIDSTNTLDFYHKSKLVVGTELTPYPQIFCRLDNMLGGVMARDLAQGYAKNFKVRGTDTFLSCHVAPVICYESVYGEWCRDYVRDGAQAIAIITNDAWWGNTPGYRQHLRYASLRAIETRRDIVRCANTGISAIINQRGDVLEKTQWWKPAVLRGRVNLSDRKTHFVLYGDVVGKISAVFAVLMLLSLVVRLVTKKRD